MKTGFFESTPGNKSISRIIGLITVIWALSLATVTVYFGHKEASGIMVTASAGGTIFMTIAGPVLVFLFGQKKTEATNTPEQQ